MLYMLYILGFLCCQHGGAGLLENGHGAGDVCSADKGLSCAIFAASTAGILCCTPSGT